MPSKYRHRRAGPPEFNRLRREANMSLNDFLYLTGRYSKAVREFSEAESTEGLKWVPTMGDVMILELAARYPPVLELMRQIADEYSLGASAAELDRAEQIKRGEPL